MSIYLTPQMLNPDFKSRETGERFGFLRRLFQSIVRKWRRRKLIAAFEALDDRVLRDIGVNRSGIKRLVEGFDNQELRMVPVAPAQTTTWLEGE